MSLAWALGMVVASVASLLGAAWIAVYVLRTNPEAFLKARALADEETREPQEPLDE